MFDDVVFLVVVVVVFVCCNRSCCLVLLFGVVFGGCVVLFSWNFYDRGRIFWLELGIELRDVYLIDHLLFQRSFGWFFGGLCFFSVVAGRSVFVFGLDIFVLWSRLFHWRCFL